VNEKQLIQIICRINPRLWEKFFPHVLDYFDQPNMSVTTPYERSALNPQPLPPHERHIVGSALLAHEIARLAIETEARGESSYSFVSDAVDDWCGTPWPGKFPHPRGGSDPEPDPWTVATGRVVAAIVFTSYADRIADDKFSAIFADAADRLVAAATTERTVGTAKARNTAAVKKTRR
jgi:hypothetical protein